MDARGRAYGARLYVLMHAILARPKALSYKDLTNPASAEMRDV